MKLLVATTNQDKLREIRAVFANLTPTSSNPDARTSGPRRTPGIRVELVTLSDLPPIAEPEENGATFWENARVKALTYARAGGLITAAEDSGLEIAALGGEPGVRSARFLGPGVSYAQRFDEIYRRLSARAAAPRVARFVTAVAVADPDGSLLFETETAIDGTIAPRPAGANGFGYDPIFWYPPLQKTTGEMTLDEKCAVSHRARGFRDLVRWISQHGTEV